ncbi:universal stress protein [Halosolutus halophilus]|uniref:universal stress protein n=1 Tax=Halosolutus halophilus TaxID=1552990 RepID=UPI0022351C6A|nr:universal stress protein [Halosolutus halophilus]
MYQVVLAVGEDEEIAESMVEKVASLPDASQSVRAIVVHVFKDVEAPPSAAVWEPPRREDPDDEVEQEVHPATLAQVVDGLADHGVAYEIRVERGNPPDEIVRIANELDAEGIYIGGRKRSPAGKMLFGSTTQSVMFATDQPVTVFGAPQ